MTENSKTVFEVVEKFISLEGEAQYTNYPTVYLRLARCNFTCFGFNNPKMVSDTKGYAPLTFIPKEYYNLKDIPIIEKGCDSQYAVNPAFSHMWEKQNTDEVVDDLLNLLPGNSWQHPVTKQNYIFSITGGEPSLHWKKLDKILFHPKMKDCRHVIFETNAAVTIDVKFINYIAEWLDEDSRRRWTWANSPKLSISGEPRASAIRPDVVGMQYQLRLSHPDQVDQYFKFVSAGDESEWSEIRDVMQMYYNVLPEPANIWIMPVACTQEQQQEITKKIAVQCIERGYLFSYRMQNLIWGNGVGT